MKDYSIKKGSSLKSRFKLKGKKEKAVDINANNEESTNPEENSESKEFRRRTNSAPLRKISNTASAIALKQLANVVSSRLQREPEIVHNYKTFKIAVLGASGVGKTSILERFVNGNFNSEHIQTISEVYETGLFLNHDEKLKQFDLELRDFNGEIKEEYNEVYENAILEAHGCIIIYSKDYPESVNKAIEIMGDIKNLQSSKFITLIMENKTDMCITSNKVISPDTFNLQNCLTESVSAKQNINIEDSMSRLIYAIEDNA